MFSTFLPNRTLITLGPLAVQWYGLTAALGAVLAYWLCQRIARRVGLPPDRVGDTFFLVLVTAVVGARLWHVVGDFGYYRAHLAEIPAIWQGGLAFHGGLVAGALALWWSARRWQLPVALLADVFAPLVTLAVAVGRWGNYFNQELFGRPTALPWGIPIASALRPAAFATGERFHPVFLYESLGLLLITALLVLAIRNRERCAPLGRPGVVAASMLVLAGLLRVGMEFLRVDAVLTISGVRVPLLVSFGVIIFGAWLLLRLVRRPSPHERALGH